MKLLVVALAALALMGWSQVGTAQEPPPDFGETNLLLLGCQFMWEVAEAQDLTVKNCRRYAPDEVNGNRALVHVRLMTDWGPFILHVRLSKSLWSVSTFEQG